MACGYGACYGCVVEIDGELKKVVRGRTGAVLLLNASGCLDALTAPDVAALFDAFVTKTVTPEPRAGQPAGSHRRDGARDAQRDRSREPGTRRVPRPRRCRVWLARSTSRSGCRSAGSRVRDYVETCEQLARDEVACIELNLSCPNVDEAPESAAEIVAPVAR